MSYYPTLEEDLARAKEILANGQRQMDALLLDELPDDLRAAMVREGTGAIRGADSYAAAKLLASFVEAIEAVGPDVAKVALRVRRLGQKQPNVESS